jgi:hypothetical protein
MTKLKGSLKNKKKKRKQHEPCKIVLVNYLARITKIFQTIDAVPLYRVGIVT